MRRAAIATMLVTAVLAGAGCGDAPDATDRVSAQAAAPPPSQSSEAEAFARLALHIEAYSASEADNVIIVARLFDKETEQANAIREATGGQWKGSHRGGGPTTAPPAAWADRVQLSHSIAEFVPIFERRMLDDQRAILVVRPILAGLHVRAAIVEGGMTIESNEAIIEPPTAPGLDTLVARGRLFEMRERWSDLAGVADELVALDDKSAWGHYYRGVVERARRNPEAARAAFQRALDRVTPGQEPPIGLIEAVKQ
jgi:hypothetical protein